MPKEKGSNGRADGIIEGNESPPQRLGQEIAIPEFFQD
jgi:hypothetical protein